MNLKLSGRVALVTGASVGIGRGIATCLAREDVAVILLARRNSLLLEVARQCTHPGVAPPMVMAGDVTSASFIEQVGLEVLDKCGKLDILVNCAGGSRPIHVNAGAEKWDEAFDLNFTALRRLTELFLPSMIARKNGRIVNVTGTSEPRGLSAATSAKAAVHAWSKGLADELGPLGVTVNCVAPGRIMSEQVRERLYPSQVSRETFAKANIPVGYFGDPEDVGNLVTFLSSPLAKYITGEIVHVDGGLRRHAF